MCGDEHMAAGPHAHRRGQTQWRKKSPGIKRDPCTAAGASKPPPQRWTAGLQDKPSTATITHSTAGPTHLWLRNDVWPQAVVANGA